MDTDKGNNKNIPVTMDDWFPVYKALATLELDKPEIRKSAIPYLNELGLQCDSLEKYWKRVRFIANNVHGNVLEIGCATGNITRYISKNENVTSVLSVDILPVYVNFLGQLKLNKVNACVLNLIEKTLSVGYKFDCVILSELIEHITTSAEISILENMLPNLNDKAEFIITTPIGFMNDPTHIRGFSKIACILHILLFYGDILKTQNNSIQQFYVVRNRNRNFPKKLYKLVKRVKKR